MSARPLLSPVYPITDRRLSGLGHRAQMRMLLRAGFSLIQLREYELPDREFLVEAAACARMAKEHGALLLINNRVDIAAMARAAGVHVGDEDLPAAAARKILGRRALIGVSTHSVEQALRASREGLADYIAIGPIYATSTKRSGRRPLGPEAVARIRRRTTKPIVAIGGITPSRAVELWEAGAGSVAVIAALWRGDFRKNAARFHEAWERHLRRPSA